MSKRQEKIAKRNEEHRKFMKERRTQQLVMLEHMFEVGNRLFEDNKDKLSKEEIAQIEKMRTEQLEALADVRRDVERYTDGEVLEDSRTQT